MYEWIYYYYYYYLVLPLIFCKAITGPNFCKATTGPAAAADAAESIIIDQNWRANWWFAKIYSIDNRKSNWLCSYNVRAFRTAGWDCEVCDSVGISFYTFWLERRRSLFRWLPRNVLCLFCSKFTTLLFFFFLVRVYTWDDFNFAIWLGSHTAAPRVHVFQGRCKHNRPPPPNPPPPPKKKQKKTTGRFLLKKHYTHRSLGTGLPSVIWWDRTTWFD